VKGVLLAFVALLLAEAPGATPPPSKAADRCHFDPDKIDVQRDIVAPKKVKHVPPVYPQAAKESGKSGTVVVEVVLSPSGKPVKTSIKTSIDPDLDRAAMEAVQQWEYTPTLVLGQACPTVLDVSVRFVLDEPRSDAAPVMDDSPSPGFAERECGIRLSMPAPREHGTRTLHLPAGDVAIHQYRILVGTTTHGLVCARSTELDKGGLSRQLDLMRDSILKSNGATLVSERTVRLSDRDGREILGRGEQYSIRAQLFIWPDRTINISVIGSEADLAGGSADDFFASVVAVKP
jgi:TonB family protein